jgi:putative endopeptidase
MRFNVKYLNRIILLVIVGMTTACEPSATSFEASTQAVEVYNMDSSISPTDNFFQFVNGKWLGETEIPADQGRWGSFNELSEKNNAIVLSILEKAATSDQYEEGSDQYKAAKFYGIGMDSLLAESVGTQPVQSLIDQINNIEDKAELQEFLSFKEIYGGRSFFDFYVATDLKSSNEITAYFSQSGLGLPNRDYYFDEDDKSISIRGQYLVHISRMLQLFGEEATSADDKAQAIVALETRLASASLTNVERRNQDIQYNKYALSDLSMLSNSVDWPKYFSDMGITTIDTIIVKQPRFLEMCERIFKETPMPVIKDYLIWGQINSNANYLNHEIVSAHFDFYSTTLRGVEEMSARWKRVLRSTNGALGEAIGKMYVEETFPPEAKLKAKQMVNNIKMAFAERIKNLAWMTDSTKEMALRKLEKMVVKIGYPDEWRDYVALEVSEDPEGASFAQNMLNARKFQFGYQLAKFGQPVNKKEWGMSPQRVNAYFNPTNNEIVFPAAILQPPFYNYKADEAVNYGGIGAVIGHEISHSFDDQGSKYDAEGNLKNWWGEADTINFSERTALLVDQYNGYEPLDGVFVNGQFTLGENIGDLGGVNAAYDGLQRYLAENGRPSTIDGMTPEQRFFTSWATIWRAKYKDDEMRSRIKNDTHSPGMYRANGPLSNMPAFYEAFDVKPGDAMHRHDSIRVNIW